MMAFIIVSFENIYVRPNKKKDVFPPDFYKKKRRAGGFFCYLLFSIACFL